ncbi:cytochrome P450 1B1, partial [Ceratobasidium sp. UAMH 11750]
MGKTTLAVLPVALLFALGLTHFRLNKKEPFPPGPPGSFIFGNALEIRRAKYLWLKLADLAKLYGPILTLRLPVSPVIVVSDAETVTELFEKRSSNFSNRPVIQMVHLGGWGDRVIFTQYNQTWRLYRKLLHRALNSQVTPDYQEAQVYEVRRLMKRLVDDPGNFLNDVHLMVGSASVRILYGHTVQGPDDRFIVASEEIMSAVKEAIVPGRWLVDTLPI